MTSATQFRCFSLSRKWGRCLLAGLIAVAVGADNLARAAARAGTVVTINPDLVLVLNGQKVFPIGFTTAPPPDGKTPEGKNGLRELADAGGMFMRTGSTGGRNWDQETVTEQAKWLDAAAKHGRYSTAFQKTPVLANDPPEKPSASLRGSHRALTLNRHPNLLRHHRRNGMTAACLQAKATQRY